MIWFEAYYIEYIIPIINFLLFLRKLNIDNIFNMIESLIKDENFSVFVEIKNMKENTKKVNNAFYIIISSLLKIYFLNIGNIISNTKEIESLKNLENNLVINLESIKVINNQLNLNCKHVFLYEEFVKMIKYILFEVSNKDLEVKKNLILEFIKINNNIKENKENQDFHINQYLDKYKNIFINKKTQNSEEILSFILIEEYRREPNEKNKEYLLKMILDKENIFQNNISFIMEIIYSPLKKFLFKNIDILVDISSIEGSFSLLNESKKIEKTIIKIFDLLINIYYDSINDFNIFTSKLFNIFKSYLKTLTDEKDDNYYAENNNDNLLKLFALSFVKIYLIKFILLINENKNILKGTENEIINEIVNTNSFKNTLFAYIIILISNQVNKDEKKLNNFLAENLKEIFKFYNEKKDNLDKTEFNKIFELKIPEGNNYPFAEYFSEIDFPTIDNFKKEFLSLNINKEKYPLLWNFIENNNLKKMEYLFDYNDFVETMINNYSGKISRKEAKNISVNEIEIYKDNNFREKFTKFKKIFNQILFEKDEDKLSDRDKLVCFLIDDDEKNDYGIKIKKGYDKFINWQNSFINSIIKSEHNKHFKHYLPTLKLEVDIQKAKKFQTILIDENFTKTNFINFRGLITLYSKRIENNNINKFEYDYDKIEEELAKIILPNKLLFSEKNFYYMIYQFEGSNINNDYLINFENKYGCNKLDEDDKKKIFKYFENNYKFYSIFDEQFIILINYLSNKSSMKKDTPIFDCISDAKKKNINFNNNFAEFFSKEGKEITIEKLLECINIMEMLCFDKLRNEINDKYKIDFDKPKEKEINNYFEKEHKDKIITKNEIAIALRRFILKIILDEKKEDKISSTSLYKNLYRKDLWNFKIFEAYKNENDFKQKIKEYLDKFSLETNDCLAFYNIIGKNEIDKLEKDKKNYGSVEGVNQDNLVLNLNGGGDGENKKKMKKKKK